MIQAITQQRLEETLARYVSMPTVTNNIEACTAAIESIAAEYKELGLTVHTDGPNHPWLVATTQPESMIAKQVKILFVIHFDVVPFENDAQHRLRITEDKLFGRGVYDMKFAAAAVKEMVSDFAKEKRLNELDFGVLITTDEEMGGRDGALEFLKQGWRCDLAVIPDSGYNWSIERRAKGMTYLYVTAYGRSAHSSRPWLGDNPISKLAPAVTEIASHFKNEDHNSAVVSINAIESSNSLHANTTQIAKWARIGISVRAFTKTETQTALDFINTVAKKYNLTTETALDEPDAQLREENPLVQTFIEVATEIHGSPIEFSDAYAASDARHFGIFDIATVQMYPCGGDHHGPNEWISRGDLYKYYSLCRQFTEQAAVTHSVPAGAKRYI